MDLYLFHMILRRILKFYQKHVIFEPYKQIARKRMGAFFRLDKHINEEIYSKKG